MDDKHHSSNASDQTLSHSKEKITTPSDIPLQNNLKADDRLMDSDHSNSTTKAAQQLSHDLFDANDEDNTAAMKSSSSRVTPAGSNAYSAQQQLGSLEQSLPPRISHHHHHLDQQPHGIYLTNNNNNNNNNMLIDDKLDLVEDVRNCAVDSDDEQHVIF